MARYVADTHRDSWRPGLFVYGVTMLVYCVMALWSSDGGTVGPDAAAFYAAVGNIAVAISFYRG